jgi:outer membrane receptor protein involved in Fe transport
MIDSGQNFLFWKAPDQELTPAPATSSPQRNSRLLIDPTLTYSLSSKTLLRAKARHYTTDNQILTGQSSLGVNQLLELSITHTRSKNLDMTGGLFALKNDVHSDSIYGRHVSKNFAAFGQVNYRYNRTFISLGLRAESYQTDERDPISYLVGRLGVNQKVGRGTFFRASAGQGFRNPAIGELFVKTSASVLRVFPNPELQPEKGIGYEVGVRQLYRTGKTEHSLDVAGYANYFDNFSEFTFGVWLPPGVNPIQSINYLGFKSLNSDLARLAGIEVEYLFRYKLKEEKRVEIQSGYTYTSATAEDPAGKRVNLRFRYAHLVKLNAQYVGGKLEAGLFARYNSRMIADDPTLLLLVPGSKDYRIARPDGDLIIDARIGYSVRKWLALSFVVKNLANQGYMVIPGNLGPQRSFVFQQSFRF